MITVRRVSRSSNVTHRQKLNKTGCKQRWDVLSVSEGTLDAYSLDKLGDSIKSLSTKTL